jgi:hypothetical protein
MRLRPFFMPLLTEARGRGILRSSQARRSRKVVPLTVRGELGGLPETPAEVLYPLPCRPYLRLLETPCSPWEPSLRFRRK